MLLFTEDSTELENMHDKPPLASRNGVCSLGLVKMRTKSCKKSHSQDRERERKKGNKVHGGWDWENPSTMPHRNKEEQRN